MYSECKNEHDFCVASGGNAVVSMSASHQIYMLKS